MQDATRVNRYLAITVRMTGYELLLEVAPILLSICRLAYFFRRGEISPSSMFRFETELQNLLRELGRRIMEWTLNRLEPEDRSEMPSQLLWNGDYYRRRTTTPLRNLNCLFGPIKLLRFCYQPLETSGKCLFPLEIQLGSWRASQPRHWRIGSHVKRRISPSDSYWINCVYVTSSGVSGR